MILENRYVILIKDDLDCYKLLTPEEEAANIAKMEAWMEAERERCRKLSLAEILAEI